MKRTIIYSLLVVLLATSVGLVSCKPAAPEAKETIKIGALLEMTGALAPYGPRFKEGIEMALEDAGREVAGRRIEFILEDYGSTPDGAMDKVKKLVERDKIQILLGPLFTPAGTAVLTYLESTRIPNITFEGHDVAVMDKYKGKNLFMGPFGALGPDVWVFAEYFYKELGYRRASIITADHVSSVAQAGVFIPEWQKLGGTIVEHRLYPRGTADFGPYFSVAKPTDVILVHEPINPARYVKQAREYGIKAPVVIFNPMCVAAEATLAEIGDVGLGTYTHAHYSWLLDTSGNKKFVEGFDKKYGHKPFFGEADGYLSTSVALEALRLTKGDTTPEKLNQALRGIEVKLPWGNTQRFSPSGWGYTDNYVLKRVKVKGEYGWEPVKKYFRGPSEGY